MSDNVEQTHQQNPIKRREHPIEIRVAVITLHFFHHDTFKSMEQLLGISQQSAAGIWRRAVLRCQDPTDFKELVACVRNAHRSGRPSIIVEGTPASQQLRTLFAQHYQMDFKSIATLLTGLKIARSTLERIAYDHRDPVNQEALVRRVQYLKPTLTLDHQDLRVEFCN